MTRLSRIVACRWSRLSPCRLALAAFLALTLAASLSAQQQAPDSATAPTTVHPRRQAIQPLVTGTNGTQTGIASFFGNFTTISAPSGELSVFHEPDCAVNFVTGTYTIQPFSYKETQLATNYEQTLHSEAQLTTKPDVFANGCPVKAPVGFGSRPGVFVGDTTTGLSVFAAVGLTYPNDVEGIYLLEGVTTFTLSSFQDSTAGLLTAADLNKDGNGDLVIVDTASATAAKVTVMLGNSDGTFQNGVTYPIAGNYSAAAVIDDVNGDGKLDIVAVSGDQQISVLLGNGDGTFQAAKSFTPPVLPGYTSANAPILNMITADVNGDSKKDIVCNNGLVLLGNNDGTFTPFATPAFPYVQDGLSNIGMNIASGDLNNDGKIDLIVNDGNTVSTWLGAGNGTFTQGLSYATINTDGFLAVDDLDGDGNLDVLVALGDGGVYGGDDNNPSLIYALMGNGNGSLQGAPSLISGGYNGNNLLDLNGDGLPDLVVLANGQGPQAAAAGSLTVALNNGKGAFIPGVNIAPPSTFTLNGYNFTMGSSAQASTYALGDVNGDGKPDVVWVANGLNTINPGSGLGIVYPYPVYFIALGNGDGTFQTATAYAFPQIAPPADFDDSNTVTNLEIADVNHDGHNDLIFAYNETAGGTGVNSYNQGFGVLLGNGNETFKAPVLTSTYSSNTAPTNSFVPQIVNVGDLNGDNYSDLIVNSPGTTIVNFQLQTQLQAYVGNGDGSFKAPVTINTGADTYATVLTDLNKDGKLDLATLTESSSSQASLAVLLGNGDGTFGTATISNLTGGDAIRSAALAAADFDGNGTVDLVLLDPNDFSGVFYGNGDGTFSSVNTGSFLVPKDHLNVVPDNYGVSAAIGIDLNKDGKPDILNGGVTYINIYGSAPSTLPSTTTTLATSLTPAVVGTSVKFTATVAGPSGNTTVPTGSVTFMDGTTSLVSSPLSAGVATYSTSALTVATHSITAVYSGDTNFTGSTSNTISEVVNLATPAVTVTPSPTSITIAQSTTVTVAVAATTGNGTPTGSVKLTSGSYASSATTLSAGSAAITIPAGSLAVGTDTLTATYTPDSSSSSTYATGTGTNTVTVTSNVPPPSFALTNSGAITVTRGATTGNTATITVAPSGGFTGSVTLTAALATSPSGASELPTFSFGSTSPVTISSASNGTATLTVSTTAVTSSALHRPAPPNARGIPFAAGGATLACVLILGLRARRRRWLSLLGMFALLVFLAGAFVSCGGGGGGKTGGGGGGNPGTTAGVYTVTVTGTSGSSTQTTTVNLTVN